MLSRPSPHPIGVCVTGQQRDLLEWPVVTSFHEHVVRPLARPDLFFALSDSLPKGYELQIRKAYGAHTVAIVDASDLQGGNMSFIQQCKHRIGYGGSPILRAWTSIGACYDAVVAAEQSRKSAYEWLYRIRTDLVFLSDIFAPPAAEVVLVPGGGMTQHLPLRCMNDHMTACPRRLCRPYFHLLDLFREGSSAIQCTASRAMPECEAAYALAFLTREPADRRPMPAHAPCRLPRPPAFAQEVRERPGMAVIKPREHSEQWFFYWAYGGRLESGGRECDPRMVDSHCCGRLRQRTVHYSVARRVARGALTLECDLRMRELWVEPNATSPFLIQRCKQVEREWRRHLDGVGEAPTELPGGHDH